MARPQQRRLDSEVGDIFSQEFGKLALATDGGRIEAHETGRVYVGGKAPPDVIQFVEDPYYLGGQIAFEPEVLQLLWDIEDPEIREVDLELGKFGAKSTVASIVELKGICDCSHMINPQGFFGLDASTIISCATVSINREQAKSVIFQRIRELVSKSPYFRTLNPQIFTTWITFPKNLSILCGHSGSTAQLGMGTLRAAMDEANYMIDNDNRTVAQELSEMLLGSMETRFPNHYKFLAISSVTLPTTWLHKRVVQSEREGGVYIGRLRGMRVEAMQSMADGRQLIRVSCNHREGDEIVVRTLAMEHRLAVLGLGVWEQAGDGWTRIVEARDGKVLDGG